MPDNETLEQQLTDAFMRLGKMFTRASIIADGIINEVDESSWTCTIDIQGSNPDGSVRHSLFYNVPLKVLIGSQASFVEVPAINSACTMTFKDNNIQRPELFQVQVCDKILIKIGDSTLQIDATGFVFNGGTLNGLVKVDSNVDRLNKIEDDVNDLKTKISGWTPVPNDGGAALKIALTTWYGASLVKTVRSDIENTKIKQ